MQTKNFQNDDYEQTNSYIYLYNNIYLIHLFLESSKDLVAFGERLLELLKLVGVE